MTKNNVPRVLIVDDNEKITRMLSRYLEVKGFSCRVENDGANALGVIKNGGFDAILLDLAMPEFSGYDIIDRLEKQNRSASGNGYKSISHYNIILFTASSVSQEEVDDLIRTGAKDCLRKPVKMETVIQTIDRIINGKSYTKQRQYNI